jgi:hypothetical protein
VGNHIFVVGKWNPHGKSLPDIYGSHDFMFRGAKRKCAA